MASGMGWLKGCAIGCGLMIVLGIACSFGGGFMLMKPFKDAVDAREKLEETYGTQADYRPPPDGAPAPDRMEIFLDVRTELMAHCGEFAEAFAQFRRMDALDEDELSGGQKIKEVFKTVREGFGMAGKLGRLAVHRNEALQDHGMGLGEYTYIYALAYYAWLEVQVEDIDDDNVQVEDSSPRVRRALRDMLRHQLDDARDATGSDPVLIEELVTELERLGDDRSLYPWQGAVPARIDAALAPYRGRLEAAFCPETAIFALSTHREGNKGLSITSD